MGRQKKIRETPIQYWLRCLVNLRQLHEREKKAGHMTKGRNRRLLWLRGLYRARYLEERGR